MTEARWWCPSQATPKECDQIDGDLAPWNARFCLTIDNAWSCYDDFIDSDDEDDEDMVSEDSCHLVRLAQMDEEGVLAGQCDAGQLHVLNTITCCQIARCEAFTDIGHKFVYMFHSGPRELILLAYVAKFDYFVQAIRRRVFRLFHLRFDREYKEIGNTMSTKLSETNQHDYSHFSATHVGDSIVFVRTVHQNGSPRLTQLCIVEARSIIFERLNECYANDDALPPSHEDRIRVVTELPYTEGVAPEWALSPAGSSSVAAIDGLQSSIFIIDLDTGTKRKISLPHRGGGEPAFACCLSTPRPLSAEWSAILQSPRAVKTKVNFVSGTAQEFHPWAPVLRGGLLSDGVILDKTVASTYRCDGAIFAIPGWNRFKRFSIGENNKQLLLLWAGKVPTLRDIAARILIKRMTVKMRKKWTEEGVVSYVGLAKRMQIFYHHQWQRANS